jgi:hypothetical protein
MQSDDRPCKRSGGRSSVHKCSLCTLEDAFKGQKFAACDYDRLRIANLEIFHGL